MTEKFFHSQRQDSKVNKSFLQQRNVAAKKYLPKRKFDVFFKSDKKIDGKTQSKNLRLYAQSKSFDC